ncbi:MAG: TadE family protein, partial [Eubacteriales bacterium]
MIWLNDFRKTEQGQAIVEMALVLPILIMLIFGIVEFGRILNTNMIVTDLSREGARKGAVGGTDG